MKSMFKSAFGALIVMLALCGLTAASALAAGAPVVETKHATEMNQTEADLTGKVEPNGAETKFYFEYGPTIAYGTKTKEQTTTTLKEPFKLVTGLAPRTTYHFRLVATNSYGTTDGFDEQFATTPTEAPEFVGSFPTRVIFSSGAIELHSGNNLFECTTEESEWTIPSATRMTGQLKFAKCTWGGPNGQVCKTAGANAGEIRTESLEGIPVYLSKAKKEAALELIGPAGAHGPQFTGEILCSVWKFKGGISGVVVSSSLATNKSKQEFFPEFKETVGGGQSPSEFELGEGRFEKSQLMWYAESEAGQKIGLTFSGKLFTNKAIEIKA